MESCSLWHYSPARSVASTAITMCTSGCQSARGLDGCKSNHLTPAPPTLTKLSGFPQSRVESCVFFWLPCSFSPGWSWTPAMQHWYRQVPPAAMQTGSARDPIPSLPTHDRISSVAWTVHWAGGGGTGRDPSQPVPRPLPALADLGQAMGPLLPIGMPHNPPPSPPRTTSRSWGRFAISSPSWSSTAHGGSHPKPLSRAQG